MASIWTDSRNGTYLIKFRVGGKAFTRSCRTDKANEAGRIKAVVEETIGLLATGRLSVPDDVEDLAVWVMSGGKVAAKPQAVVPEKTLLGEVCDAYLAAQAGKAASTLACERVHTRHLRRHLGESKALRSITVDDLQAYVHARGQEKNRTGGKVQGVTVKKELTTFSQVWDWARRRRIVVRPCPLKDESGRRWAVSVPKPEEVEKFMTWAEIERRVAREGLGEADAKRLWKYLYLDEFQRDELLEHVRQSAAHEFIHPMFAFAAFTGARRSEIRRSLIEDFRFEEGTVMIRERKRRKDRAGSSREVPMHPKLRVVMAAWFERHPGGRYTIVPPVRMPRRSQRPELARLTEAEAHHHFKAAIADSKWKVLRGFHVLRHSFGAICTRKAVPMNVIAKWMGHTTDEMMRHYQHLHPADEQEWMKRLA